MSTIQNTIFARGEFPFANFRWQLYRLPTVPLQSAGLAKDVSDDESAFYALLPTLRREYRNLFVAISGGELFGSSSSRVELARRFFRERGDDATVYIGYVGEETPVLQATPIVVR